jgi:hypothetical protein
MAHSGVALSQDARTMAFCNKPTAGNVDSESVCKLYDRDTVTARFNLVHTFGSDKKDYGLHGVALSANGLVFSSCTELGQYCHVCDRTSRNHEFTCHEAAPKTPKGTFAWGGPSLSADGLKMVACSHNEDGTNTGSKGSCSVFYRSATNEQFTNDKKIKVMMENGHDHDYFGHGGGALSSDGKTLTACSHGYDARYNKYMTVTSEGRRAYYNSYDVGACYVCTIDYNSESFKSRKNQVQEGSITRALVVDKTKNVWEWANMRQEEDYFGMGGAALSDDGLVFAACAHNTNKKYSYNGGQFFEDDTTTNNRNKGECLVCARASVNDAFPYLINESNIRCVSIKGSTTIDEFGKYSPTLSGDGTAFVACSKDWENKDENSYCQICTFKRSGDRIVDKECETVEGDAAQPMLGYYGAAVQKDDTHLHVVACSPNADNSGGSCSVYTKTI